MSLPFLCLLVVPILFSLIFFFFFFNDTATTEIYTLSLHDALPILGLILGSTAGFRSSASALGLYYCSVTGAARRIHEAERDRKSTRLNSSHSQISYAVFCLKKKKKKLLTLHAHRRKIQMMTTYVAD